MKATSPLIQYLKAMAHPDRLRILAILRKGPACVCHLQRLLNRPQPYISQQLRLLRQAGLVSARRQGQLVFYELTELGQLRWMDLLLRSAVPALPRRLSGCPCPTCHPNPRKRSPKRLRRRI